MQAQNDPIAPFPTELPLTRPTGLSATMVGLQRARMGKGMADVLAKALWLKNYCLAPFPTELTLTGPTRLSADKVRLERARAAEGMAEVLAESLWLKNYPLSLPRLENLSNGQPMPPPTVDEKNERKCHFI